MPLVHGKSERSFSHNVGAEMEAGKPQKQALAIAYAVKRKAEKKRMAYGGYADGGDVEPEPNPYNVDVDKASQVSSSFKKALGYQDGGYVDELEEPYMFQNVEQETGLDDDHPEKPAPITGTYAKGGAVEGHKSGHNVYDATTDTYIPAEDNVYDATTDTYTPSVNKAHGGIIDRIMAKHYSEGGMVANEQHAIAGSEMNEYDDLANRDDLYSCYTGENSGDELGDEQEDHDRHDIVSRIMRSRRMRDRMPATGQPGYAR